MEVEGEVEVEVEEAMLKKIMFFCRLPVLYVPRRGEYRISEFPNFRISQFSNFPVFHFPIFPIFLFFPFS